MITAKKEKIRKFNEINKVKLGKKKKSNVANLWDL